MRRLTFSLVVISHLFFQHPLSAAAAPDNVISITGSEKGKEYLVSISGIEADKATVFEVENPTRLVVDLPVTKRKIVREPLKENPYVLKIRIGMHPDKTRVVLDLKDPKPKHSSVPKKKVLTIRFEADSLHSESLDREKEPSPEKKKTFKSTEVPTRATPTNTPKNTASPTAISEKVPTRVTPKPTVTKSLAIPTATPVPTSKSTLAATPTKSPIAVEEEPTPKMDFTPTSDSTISISKTPYVKPEGQEVTGIHFKKDEQGPYTEISLVDRSEYSLTKVKNRKFKLTVPRCSVGPKGLLLPHFPPNDITGFTLVQIVPGTSGVDIFISVDDGMKVTAVNVGNSIILRPVAAGF